MVVVDNTWHHVCVTWKARERMLNVYKDGEEKYSTNRFWSHVENKEIEGKYCYPYLVVCIEPSFLGASMSSIISVTIVMLSPILN